MEIFTCKINWMVVYRYDSTRYKTKTRPNIFYEGLTIRILGGLMMLAFSFQLEWPLYLTSRKMHKLSRILCTEISIFYMFNFSVWTGDGNIWIWTLPLTFKALSYKLIGWSSQKLKCKKSSNYSLRWQNIQNGKFWSKNY